MINIFLFAVIGCSFAALLFCDFMLFRNHWVHRNRVRILNESSWNGREFDKFATLPSYDAMMWQFWNWDGDSFIGKGR